MYEIKFINEDYFKEKLLLCIVNINKRKTISSKNKNYIHDKMYCFLSYFILFQVPAYFYIKKKNL
jgi:hypothetical protein